MITWHLEKRLIKDLKPHPKNPRELSKDQERQLSASLDKFGQVDKLVINTDGTIIGGHQRYRILKKKGIKDIDCWVPDLPLADPDMEELMVRLNKNSGSFDYDILANQFEVTDLLEWGFSESELTDFADLIEDEPKEPKAKKKHECPNCGCEF